MNFFFFFLPYVYENLKLKKMTDKGNYFMLSIGNATHTSSFSSIHSTLHFHLEMETQFAVHLHQFMNSSIRDSLTMSAKKSYK